MHLSTVSSNQLEFVPSSKAVWKGRLAYRIRIYYNSQLTSKKGYQNSKYWAIDKELEKLYPRIKKNHYKGKPTRLIERIERLEQKLEIADYRRWGALYESLF